MSVQTISTIALSTPLIASNAIFSSRRADRGVDAMEENPLYGAANINLAAAQVLKGGRAAKSIGLALNSEPGVLSDGAKHFFPKKQLPSFVDTIRKNSVFKTTGNVLNFTANNINPVIVGTSAIKIATSDDKVDTWAREATSLLTMFGAEEVTKNLVGMPTLINKKGKNEVQFRKAGATKFIKQVLSNEQYNAIQRCIEKNKAAKIAFASGKGLLFAGASIAGYKAGNKISDTILGEKVA